MWQVSVKIRNGNKVLRVKQSLLLSHSWIQLPPPESPHDCKISRLLPKDKNMKANSTGIKRFHQSGSGYLWGFQRWNRVTWVRSQGHRGEVTFTGKRITCPSAAGRFKLPEVLLGTLLFRLWDRISESVIIKTPFKVGFLEPRCF